MLPCGGRSLSLRKAGGRKAHRSLQIQLLPKIGREGERVESGKRRSSFAFICQVSRFFGRGAGGSEKYTMFAFSFGGGGRV